MFEDQLKYGWYGAQCSAELMVPQIHVYLDENLGVFGV